VPFVWLRRNTATVSWVIATTHNLRCFTRCVNRRRSVTPSTQYGSKTYRADRRGDPTPNNTYEIKTWTPSRATAIREHPCGTASMSIDVQAQAVTIATVPHTDFAGCMEDRPTIWTLVDGMPIAWKRYEDRINRARARMYEPARTLIPVPDSASVP
jgi:hypothetical protein